MDKSPRFPFELTGIDVSEIGSCVIATSLSSNVQKLHALLFKDQDYQISTKIDEISYGIDSLLGEGI